MQCDAGEASSQSFSEFFLIIAAGRWGKFWAMSGSRDGVGIVYRELMFPSLLN